MQWWCAWLAQFERLLIQVGDLCEVGALKVRALEVHAFERYAREDSLPKISVFEVASVPILTLVVLWRPS